MGLQQNIDYPDLKSNYCHVLQNIDIDDPVGVMRVRDGSRDKYNDASLANYPFTAIISAYEFRFDKASETRLIVNDNGTLKTMTDGGNPASLTLPTGATMESGFQNNYMGYKDHILITTGNGATNYMLWYGYVDRDDTASDGIFNDALGKQDYILTRSQLIQTGGTFALVESIAYLNSFYYISFTNSKWIETRDTNFQLVERWAVNEDENVTAADNAVVNISANTATGMLYVGTSGGVYEIDPDTHIMASSNTTVTSILGLCNDGKHIYAIDTDTITKILISDFSDVTSHSPAGPPDYKAISCDTTQDTGNIFVGNNQTVEQRSKVDITIIDDSNALGNQIIKIEWKDADQVYISTTNDHVFDLVASGVSVQNADNTNVVNPYAFVKVGGTTIRVIADTYGAIQHVDANTLISPEFTTLSMISHIESGTLAAGTYFYKVAVEDVDGQIYTLSDAIVAPLASANLQVKFRIVCTGDRSEADKFIEFYRIKNFHIFRGYNSVVDAGVPGTDYKFLKTIDINNGGWVNDATRGVYYFDHSDNITETEISSETYFERTGVEDTVKPRHVNPKHIEFINNKLHAGNFYHDGDNFPNRVIQSSNDAPDTLSFYNFYDYNVGDGEEIKGITSSFGRAVVFKNRKFRTFFDGVPDRDFFPGISSEGGYTKINEEIYFVSNQGIHIFNGSKLFNIHYPVITDFENASSLANVAVIYIESRDRVVFSIRNDVVLVWNKKYNIWTRYTSAMAFRGFFKNYENEYIGWDATKFKIVFDSTYVNDGEDYGGGNGAAIAIDYESPLLLGKTKGNISILETHRHRLFKGSETVTFTVYDYTLTGRSSVATQALAAPTSGTDAVAKTHFFNQVMGEAFQFRINGSITGGDFKYYGMSIDFREGGLLYR
jgi:hypothetical protein